MTAKTAAEIWRDYETEGVPSSGAHKPIKADIREWGAAAETGARKQRSVTSSPITIATDDAIINCNISSGTPTCTLPDSATRAGRPLTFIDVGNHFFLFPL